MIKKLFICEKKKKLEAVNPQQNGWDSSKLYEENINPFNYYDKCFINICQVSLYLFTVLQVNEIRTIHDRILIARNGTDLINKWTADGLCKYIDEKKYPIEAKQPEYTSHKSRLPWINWINQGKMLYGNKEKIQSVINQQRINRPCNKNCVNGHKVILYRRSTNGQQETKGKGCDRPVT